VRVEWVMAFRPDAHERERLGEEIARYDEDGTAWGRAMTLCDQEGRFRIEGIPPVPLRILIGSRVFTAVLPGTLPLRVDLSVP
jgi:hypothetical protein